MRKALWVKVSGVSVKNMIVYPTPQIGISYERIFDEDKHVDFDKTADLENSFVGFD